MKSNTVKRHSTLRTVIGASAAIALGLCVYAAVLYRDERGDVHWPSCQVAQVINLPLGKQERAISAFGYPPMYLRGAYCGLAAADIGKDGTIYLADSGGKLVVKRPSRDIEILSAPALRGCVYLRRVADEVLAASVANNPHVLRFLTIEGNRLFEKQTVPDLAPCVGLKNDAISAPVVGSPSFEAIGLPFGLGAGENGTVWSLLDMPEHAGSGDDSSRGIAVEISTLGKCSEAVAPFDVPQIKKSRSSRNPHDWSLVFDSKGRPISTCWSVPNDGGWEDYIQVDCWQSATSRTSRLIDLRRLGRVTTACLAAADTAGNVYLQFDYGTSAHPRGFVDDTSSQPVYSGNFMGLAVVRPTSDVAEPLFDTYHHYRTEIQANWPLLSKRYTEFGYVIGTGNVVGVDDGGNVYLEACTGKEYRIDKISFPPEKKPWWRFW